jgi:Flp pilus assembly pilin Flp
VGGQIALIAHMIRHAAPIAGSVVVVGAVDVIPTALDGIFGALEVALQVL